MIYNQSFVPHAKLPILGYEESQLEELQKKAGSHDFSNVEEARIPWENSYPHFHDLFFVILYIAVLSGFLALSFINIFQVWVQYSNFRDMFNYITETLKIKAADILSIVLLFGVVVTQTLVLCFILLLIMLFLCRTFILLGLVTNLSIGIWTTFWAFKIGNLWLGISSMFITFFIAWAFWGMRNKIKFSVQVLKVIALVMYKNPSIWLIFFLGMLSSWGFTLFYLITTVFAYIVWGNESNTGVIVFLTSFWIFSGYYITEVNNGVLNVCISTIFSKWYFKSKLGTFRAISTILSRCFGSICFGSLLLSLIQFIKECLNIVQNDAIAKHNYLALILMFIIRGALQFLEWLMQYFNEYAFSYMSIHSTGYLKSSTKVFQLFKAKGLDVLANDCIINTSLKMYLMIVTISASLTTYLYIQIIQPQFMSNKQYNLSLMVVSGILSLQIGRTLLNVINSGVHTLFICLTLSPEIFQINHPNENQTFEGPLEKYHTMNVV